MMTRHEFIHMSRATSAAPPHINVGTVDVLIPGDGSIFHDIVIQACRWLPREVDSRRCGVGPSSVVSIVLWVDLC